MAGVRLFAQDLQQREREAGGLAGAGLCRAEKVLACEYYGDGLRLDGGGRGVALVRDCAEQLGLEPERIKGTNENSPASACKKAGAFDRFRQMLLSLFLGDPGWTT
jgi:hypothetical protein